MANKYLTEENYVAVINSHTIVDWQPLLVLIPKIQRARTFGKWISSNKGDGTIENPYQIPHFYNSKLVNQFASFAYDLPILVNFSWICWDDLHTYLKDKTFDFDTIDIPTKCKVITAIIRADRFCESATAAEFKSGLIVRILKSIQKQLHEK